MRGGLLTFESLRIDIIMLLCCPRWRAEVSDCKAFAAPPDMGGVLLGVVQAFSISASAALAASRSALAAAVAILAALLLAGGHGVLAFCGVHRVRRSSVPRRLRTPQPANAQRVRTPVPGAGNGPQPCSLYKVEMSMPPKNARVVSLSHRRGLLCLTFPEVRTLRGFAAGDCCWMVSVGMMSLRNENDRFCMRLFFPLNP